MSTPVYLEPVEHEGHAAEFADCTDLACRQARGIAQRWNSLRYSCGITGGDCPSDPDVVAGCPSC